MTFREALNRAAEGIPAGVIWLGFGLANLPVFAWYMYRQQPELTMRIGRAMPDWLVPACLVALPICLGALATIWIRRARKDWPPISPWACFRPQERIDISPRRKRHARAGFTLIEMTVAVALVLMMMLMFAQIYGMATEVMSKQKGMANNNQKARILAEILRTDLDTRTFRDVYPFKTELQFDGTDVTPTIPSGPTAAEQDRLLREERRGYFSYSENDPANDSDDVLQFTVDVSDSGHQIWGLASPVTGDLHDQPAFDDGREDAVGASSMAEVSYYLRYGNLYRSVLLIREPYQSLDQPAHPTWGATTPASFPATVPEFWGKFDYSAYRDDGAVKFHGPASLSNNSSDDFAPFNVIFSYTPIPGFHAPRSLGVPQFRFGHSLTIHGQPVEFGDVYDSSVSAVAAAGGWESWPHTMFGRYHAQERSSAAMQFPGSSLVPFAIGHTSANDVDKNNTIDGFESSRRGVDLMLPNVHSFDVQVWDDVVGDYVNLGHERSGHNPYTHPMDTSTDPPTPILEPGFFHASRLREKQAGAGPFQTDHASVPDDFGNRYDTWNPSMYAFDGTTYFRTGRAPYRPLQANPDPNAAGFEAYEQTVAFGDKTLDDNQDGVINALDTDAEAPLRSIRIVVRYLDVNSGLTRQATIEESFVD